MATWHDLARQMGAQAMAQQGLQGIEAQQNLAAQQGPAAAAREAAERLTPEERQARELGAALQVVAAARVTLADTASGVARAQERHRAAEKALTDAEAAFRIALEALRKARQ